MRGASASLGVRLVSRPDQVEASLWRRLRGEKDVQCRLVLFEHHQSLARKIAFAERRRRPLYGLETADLLHLAYGGLLEAIDRYDPRRGIPFEAYARPRIRGAISDGLAQATESSAQYTAQVRAARERLGSLRAHSDKMEDSLQAFSSLAVGLALGFLLDGVKRNGEASLEPVALDAYESFSWRELEVGVLEVLHALPPIERTVIEQHYLHEAPFSQIATLLNLSKGRISQLHTAALKRMRSLMKESR